MLSISYRPHQRESIDAVIAQFRAGKHLVFLDAPVGSGKSLTNLTVANESSAGGIITTPQVPLVEQYALDTSGGGKFAGLATTLKGRHNYPCPFVRSQHGGRRDATAEGAPCTFVRYWPRGRHDNAEDEEGSLEHVCTSKCVEGCPVYHALDCPYYLDRERAQKAKVTVTTLAYFLRAVARTELDGAVTWGKGWKPRRLLVVDEAHSLDDDLVSHFAVELRPSYLPGFPFKDIPEPEAGKEDTSMAFLREHIPTYLADQSETLESMSIGAGPSDVSLQDDIRKQARIVERAEHIADVISRGNVRWVHSFDETKDQRGERHPFHVWRPLSVAPFIAPLWREFRFVLLSSATFLDTTRLAHDLGFPDGSWSVVTVPDTFPSKNAPIRLESVFSLNRANLAASVPKMLQTIQRILDRHPDQRGIIQCHSYQLAEMLESQSVRPLQERLVFHSREDRNHEFGRWKVGGSKNAVFVGVGTTEGIDLSYDLSRFQIILKAQFPDMGDEWVQARQSDADDGARWYDEATLMAVLQASGRIMRSATDTGVTYVLDTNVRRLVSTYWVFLPEWFRQRVLAGFDEMKWGPLDG